MIWKLSERKDWNSLEQQFGWVWDMNQVPQIQDTGFTAHRRIYANHQDSFRR